MAFQTLNKREVTQRVSRLEITFECWLFVGRSFYASYKKEGGRATSTCWKSIVAVSWPIESAV